MAIAAPSYATMVAPTNLPTSRTWCENAEAISRVHVASWTDLSMPVFDQVARENFLLGAWAGLLYKYTSNDTMVFEVFGEQAGHDRSAEAEENQLQGRVALCRLWSITKHNGNVPRTANFSIELCSKSQFPMLGDLCNTAVCADGTTSLLRQDLDILLVADCRSDTGSIDIWVRSAKVPERFASAVSLILKEVLLDLAQDRVLEPGTLNLSQYEIAQLRTYTQDSLHEHQDCMHNLFRRSVTADPNAQAIFSWDGALSYRELDTYSDRVARVLIANGVGIGDYVPFAFEKSMWSVVSVLGILKAGAAFVPLDPTQPLARVEGILRDIKARVILVSALLEDVYKLFVDKVVVVSSVLMESSKGNNEASVWALPTVEPHHTAFVLFTSGSTGKPKGMIMQHGAYSTHTICHGQAMGYTRARVLQFAAHTFDVYVMDVFATLAFQGCICIPSEEDRRFNIAKVFHDFRIDLTILTPSFANLLEPSLFPHLKTLAVGGEALKKETVQKWRTRARGTSLMQIYGPAEVGICILGSLSHMAASPETLGYPLDNSLCLLIDPDDTDRLVPLGAAGELVVAGPTMLRKYLNNPEKTKACFIDNPPWAKALGLQYRRFYRSGDLLRYNIERLDGSFDFIGRRDSQVKYHGQRMELEDLEHHLSSIPSVSACMVCLPKEGALQGKLVAIVQLESCDQTNLRAGETIQLLTDADFSIGRMREHLSQNLPAYMIPNALLVIRTFPTTPSLKLNRPAVNHWVGHLDNQSMTGQILRKVCYDKLAPDELVAQALSQEYARLVGGNDRRHRSIFEGHDFSLQEGGIDSIQIISLSNFVQKVWKVKIPMSLMLSSTATIRAIAATIIDREHQHVSDNLPQTTHVELEAHSLVKELVRGVKRPDVREAQNRPDIKNVLLTGATGFLGTAILRRLLQQGLKVFALIRDRSSIVARQRLVDQAMAAGWWKDDFASQLEIWYGNLSETQLGLDDVCRDRILGNGCAAADAIHAVVHNGAKVHYGMDYFSLRRTNVLSTLELLRLSASAGLTVQSFVYISGGQQLTFNDVDVVDDVSAAFGYARSKLISELMIKNCMLLPEWSDVRLRIVKPGYIIGAPSDGVSNLTDFLWRLVATNIEIGGYNTDDVDRWICVADKLRVAQVVVDQTLLRSSSPVTKVLDGFRISELWSMLTAEFSFALGHLPYDQWVRRIRTAVAEKQEAHVMFPLLHLLETGEMIGTVDGPAEASPGVKDALRANIRYLIKVGYLASPGGHESVSSYAATATLERVKAGTLVLIEEKRAMECM